MLQQRIGKTLKASFIDNFKEEISVLLTYQLFKYVAHKGNMFKFIEKKVALGRAAHLADSQIIIDIRNTSNIPSEYAKQFINKQVTSISQLKEEAYLVSCMEEVDNNELKHKKKY